MNRRRLFHQRWLLWGLVWVFVLASLAPAISRMQAAAGVTASVQRGDGAGAPANVGASVGAAPSGDKSLSDGQRDGEQPDVADQLAARAASTICFSDEETAALIAQEAFAGTGTQSPAADQRESRSSDTDDSARSSDSVSGHDPSTRFADAAPEGQKVEQQAAVDPHVALGHHGGLISDEHGNLLAQLSMGMPSLDCCPFCSIMADRLAPVWHGNFLLFDRVRVRIGPLAREAVQPAVVILRLPPVRGPPSPLALQV